MRLQHQLGMKDEYLEPATEVSAEIKVKGSRFIARIVPVLSQDAAKDVIRAVSKEHYDATHNCTAYRVGVGEPESRFNDDGEPNGTAGMPILRQLEGADLTNVVAVVTRYYGGTKLGTGGLARAYGDAAAEALASLQVRKRIVRTAVRVRFDYADTSPAMHTIGQFDIKVKDSTYGNRTELQLGVRQSEADRFSAAFVEALSGRGEVLAAGA
ncbi:MAG: putative YigZ family protein [Rhodothermales bacterium]|jgi:uncharacterized YigZ family protein